MWQGKRGELNLGRLEKAKIFTEDSDDSTGVS
jgi:hypothetical protein